MNTKKELNALKEKAEAQSRIRQVLTEKELDQVTGGINSKSNHKGDVVTFKLEVPVTDEVDVVEMSTSNTAICKGDNLLPAELDTLG